MYKKLFRVESSNYRCRYYACESLSQLESVIDYSYRTIEYLGEVFVA